MDDTENPVQLDIELRALLLAKREIAEKICLGYDTGRYTDADALSYKMNMINERVKELRSIMGV